MSDPIILDSGPLGRIAHPRRNPEVHAWFQRLVDARTPILVPEIADYEVRRSLLLRGLTTSVTRLDQLKSTLTYVPLTTSTMLLAAELWAQARKRGHITADPQALDGDVILAAQARLEGAIVVTDNVGHLSFFVTAITWNEIV